MQLRLPIVMPLTLMLTWEKPIVFDGSVQVELRPYLILFVDNAHKVAPAVVSVRTKCISFVPGFGAIEATLVVVQEVYPKLD